MKTATDIEKAAWLGGYDKTLTLTFDDGTVLSNEDLKAESLKITDKLCDENQFTIGLVNSKTLKISTTNTAVSYAAKWFNANISVTDSEGHSYTRSLGRYKVYSDAKTSNKTFRDIEAYDIIYDLNNFDISAWYNSFWSTRSTSTLYIFRNTLFEWLANQGFDIIQESISLVNDSMTIEKTINTSTSDESNAITESLSCTDILKAICEINGVIGHLEGSTFKYITVGDSSIETFTTDDYYSQSMSYEDYVTEKITKVTVKEATDDIGGSAGTDGNEYVILANFLCYGKSTTVLQSLAQSVLDKIKDISYRPVSKIKTQYRPWMELGDCITVNSDLESQTAAVFPILSREISGINAIMDSYSAKGAENYEKSQALASSWQQLKGRSNALSRDIDSTKSEIKYIKDNYATTSTLEQTTDTITARIEKVESDLDGDVSTYIITEEPTLLNYPAWDFCLNIPCNDTVQLADTLKFEYKDEYYREFLRDECVKVDDGLVYKFAKTDSTYYWKELAESDLGIALQKITKLSLTVDAISQTVSENETKTEEEYNTVTKRVGSLETTAESITSTVSEEVTRATTAEQSLSDDISTINTTLESHSSSIKQTADDITAEVTRATSAESDINDTLETQSTSIKQTADDITAEVTRAKGSEENLSSRIKQTVHGISLTVDNGSTTSGITIGYTDEDGETIDEASGTINMTGLVKFTDLSGSGTTTINGANIKTGTLSCDSLSGGSINGQIFKQQVYISYGTETAYCQLRIQNTYIYLDILNSDGSIKSTKQLASLYWDSGEENFSWYQPNTVLNDAQIYGADFVGYSSINIGTIYRQDSGLQIVRKTSNYGDEISFSGLPIMLQDVAGDYGIWLGYSATRKPMAITNHDHNGTTTNNLAQIGAGDVDGLIYGVQYINSTNATLYPATDGQCWLGWSGHRFNCLWVSNATIQTSDRRMKKDISYMGAESETDIGLTDDQVVEFVESLKPVSYRMIDGDSGRPHHGFIAQDIEETLQSMGIDHAGFIKSPETETVVGEDGSAYQKEKENGDYIYSLRYEEFIADLTRYSQLQTKRIEALEAEVAELKEIIKTIK